MPEGWTECNGQLINDPESPYNGQNAPSLNINADYGDRGLFLRGSTTSGVYQDDQLQDHQHDYTHVYGDDDADGGGHAADNRWATYQTSDPVTGKHGSETRPVNMSVVWIIRIK